MDKKVLVPIADGVEEIEIACIVDVLRRAGANVEVASVNELQISGSRNMIFVADKLIDDCAEEIYDLIVLPGGMPGAEYLRDCESLVKLLKAQKATDRLYAAICASPAVVLAHHGLLNDVTATCYPSLLNQLPVPDEENQDVVIDKNCITSSGPGKALQFAIKLVEILYSSQIAEDLAKELLLN
jgi:protein deglycase